MTERNNMDQRSTNTTQLMSTRSAVQTSAHPILPASNARALRHRVPRKASSRTRMLSVEVHTCDREEPRYRAYRRLQRYVYSRYGVGRAMQSTDACMHSCSHLILAFNTARVVTGGLRIHSAARGKLPVEATPASSPRLAMLMSGLHDPAELSGTVVHPHYRKSGLSQLLVETAVAALPMTGHRSALGFGHQWVMPMYRRFGFIEDRRCGDYRYPDSRYRSRVAVLHDADALDSVEPDERARIRDTRSRLQFRARVQPSCKGARS